MDYAKRAKEAKEIIERVIYLNVASVTEEGMPWNTPVYATYDEDYAFFWLSWRENQHSKNVRTNPNVFITIYDSTQAEGAGEGVYIKARAEEVNDPDEVARIVKYHYGRKNKPERPIEEFLGDYPRRFYKAVPEKIWMNSDDDLHGSFIDVRVEIQL